LNRIAELDTRFVWHPFTDMDAWAAQDPLVIVGGEANYLIDQDGRSYLDGVSSLWTNIHGHKRAEIDDAIRAQLDRIAHTTLLGLASPPAAELAARLIALAPAGLTKVFYSDNGSTAVEVALKLAFLYWRNRGRPEKRRFLSLTNAYHGDTLGAVSVGGIDLFHRVFSPLLMDTLHVSPSLDALEPFLATHAHELAAFIVEPLMQGAGGMLTQPSGFLRGAADLCKRHDVLFIADEVATGFGRTGRFFASEHEQVTPDLLVLAKGITGGYLPLAATLASGRIFDTFRGGGIFYHGHTYTGNALACAAALASLDLFERDHTLEQLPTKIGRLRYELDTRIVPLHAVKQVRQMGLMVGIELCSTAPLLGAQVCRAIRDHGVILRPLGNVVVLMPPLSITETEIVALVEATHAGIQAVCC
jgi:adenosylmethionine-8-amino-7-oxononanoate aminotransferase